MKNKALSLVLLSLTSCSNNNSVLLTDSTITYTAPSINTYTYNSDNYNVTYFSTSDSSLSLYNSSIDNIYQQTYNYFNNDYPDSLGCSDNSCTLDDELLQILSIMYTANNTLNIESLYTFNDNEITFNDDSQIEELLLFDNNIKQAYFINKCQQLDLSSLYGALISIDNNQYLLKPYYNGYYPIILSQDNFPYLQLNLINNQAIITTDKCYDTSYSQLTFICTNPYIATYLSNISKDYSFDQIQIVSDTLSQKYQCDINYVISYNDNKDIYNIKLDTNNHYYSWSDELDMQIMPLL